MGLLESAEKKKMTKKDAGNEKYSLQNEIEAVKLALLRLNKTKVIKVFR